MDWGLALSAFIAGILTFLAPCTLPIVPGFLGFISGVSLNDLKDSSRANELKVKIFFNAVFFVLGFSLVFILLGVAAGAFGGILNEYRLWLSRIGGLVVIAFGFFLLGWLNLPFLQKEKQFHLKLFSGKNYSTAFVLGLSFGFGWTPCIGPILGSVLFLASNSATAVSGGILLAIFSFGMSIPFLLIALGIGSVGSKLTKLNKYLGVLQKIGGIFLILLGLLLFFDKMYILIVWGYEFFDFIGYERLLNYL